MFYKPSKSCLSPFFTTTFKYILTLALHFNKNNKKTFTITVHVWWRPYSKDAVYHWVIGTWSVSLHAGVHGGTTIGKSSVKLMCIGNVIRNGTICKKKVKLKKIICFMLLRRKGHLSILMWIKVQNHKSPSKNRTDVLQFHSSRFKLSNYMYVVGWKFRKRNNF